MFAARRLPRSAQSIPEPLRRRAEPKSLSLLVDVVLARYGILPLEPEQCPQPAVKAPRSRQGRQALLFPVS